MAKIKIIRDTVAELKKCKAGDVLEVAEDVARLLIKLNKAIPHDQNTRLDVENKRASKAKTTTEV